MPKKRLNYPMLLCIALFALLLVSCDNGECKHGNMTKKTVDPTHTESGYTEYLCTDCEYSYLVEWTDPLGHAYRKNVVPPSCDSDGYTEYVCDCGHSYISDIISAPGHQYQEETVIPTCTKEGYTAHSCKFCSSAYISDYVNATGHSYKKSEVAPTCTSQGYTLFSCECGNTYKTDFLAPIAHTFTQTITPPTCTEQGFTTNTCTCGYVFTDTFIAPQGHSYLSETVIEADCVNPGKVKYTCDCGDTYSVISAPLGHSYSHSTTMPTLSDMGFTTYLCDVCRHTYTADLTFFSDIVPSAYAGNSSVIAKGIDISYHNYKQDSEGNYISLDWESIKNAGISYVIIRIADPAIGIDPTFEKSYTEATEAGLDVGFYFFTRATSVSEIKLEANLAISALKGKQFSYPVYLDLEDDSLIELSAPELNEMCVSFFTSLQRAGYYTGLYVNKEWLNNVIDTETAISCFDIWYARYPTLADGEIAYWNDIEDTPPLGMWQYTDSGVIDGIDHTVFDFNYCYKNYPEIIEKYGFNGHKSDAVFPDTGKSFVWIIHSNSINIRSKSDYFTTEGYDNSLDVIGYASYGERFEVIEQNEQYTAIMFNGETAYISANPLYVSFEGIYVK